MRKFAYRIFYLGAEYHGSQYQPNVRTVEGELLQALSKYPKQESTNLSVEFSGRTDKGVNSIGQLVCIKTLDEPNMNQINRNLPDDIILWAYREVPHEFNPRYGVLFRHYRYYLDYNPTKMDHSKMLKAANELQGLHDFKLLSKPDNRKETSTVLLNIHVSPQGNIYFDFYGVSFLWKLVRKTVALLIDIGNGKVSMQQLQNMIHGKNALPSGIEPAPPENLFLVEAVVSFRMRKNRNAIHIMRNRMVKKIKHLKSYQSTLQRMHTDFLNEMPSY